MLVECVELNAVHYERGSQMPLPSSSANWNIVSGLLYSLGAWCANNHCSSEIIARSISEPPLLRYPKRMEVLILKWLKSKMVLLISQRSDNNSEWNPYQWQPHGLAPDIWSCSEDQIQWNAKSAVQAARDAQWTPERMPAKICGTSIWKKLKFFIFESRQHDVANNFQGI
jgi:hypothetical protein